MRSGPGLKFGAAVWLTAIAWSGPPIPGAAARGTEVTGTIEGTVTCRGVRDCEGAIVFVERIPGRTFPPGPDVILDQAELAFIPHVLPVVTGTRVAFPNSDEVRHNVFSASAAKRFNLGTYAKGAVRYVVFDRPGVVELLCNVHADMSAYVIVADTPYAARVRPDGRYALRDVPVGTYPVVAWHEQFQESRRQVSVSRGEVAVAVFDLRQD